MQTEIWTRPDAHGASKCVYRGLLNHAFRAGESVKLAAEAAPETIRDVVIHLWAGTSLQVVTLIGRDGDKYPAAPSWESVLGAGQVDGDAHDAPAAPAVS